MANQLDEDDFNELSVAFLDWLRENGAVLSSKIELADLRHRNAGRGVLATDDIEEGEKLFSIPNKLILTVENSDLDPNFKKQLDDPWLSLILAMLFEFRQRHDGSRSRWAPYLDILPYKFDTLMYWSEEELEYLRGSAIVDKIGKASADRMFTEQLLPIVKQEKQVWFESEHSDEEMLQAFHRMGSTIMAYAFDLEDTNEVNANEDGWEEDSDAGINLRKGMIPLADMLNADADLNNARLFYEDDKVVMKAIKSIKKGEEIFNDYGPLPRADLLRRYGYITDNYAKYDVVEVSLELVKTAAKEQDQIDEKNIESRLEYLTDEGALDDSYDIARSASEEGPFSEELKILLNALSMPTSDFDKLQKKGKLPKPELSNEALILLSRVLVARKSMYSPDTDVLLQNDHPSPQEIGTRRLMAAKVIEGEKQVLHEAEQTVQTLLGGSEKRKLGNGESDPLNANNAKRQKQSEVG